MPTVQIRPAQDADRRAIHRLHLANIREVYTRVYGKEVAGHWEAARTPEGYPLEEHGITVLEEGDTLLAFGGFSTQRSEVMGLYVDPALHGKGLGLRLLAHFEAQARAAGLSQLFVESSLNAQRFYEDAGFVRVEDLTHRVGQCDVACIRMRKPLSALSSLLMAHQPSDAKERADLIQMRRFASRLAEPFSRAQEEAHFTGSALVVDPALSRVCLVHHKKLSRWLQPGGHADGADEGQMARTALREAEEETGLSCALHPDAPAPFDVDIHQIPARKDEPGHLHLDVRFLVRARHPEALAHDPHESHGARWLTLDEAAASTTEESLLRLFRKAAALQRKP